MKEELNEEICRGLKKVAGPVDKERCYLPLVIHWAWPYGKGGPVPLQIVPHTSLQKPRAERWRFYEFEA